MILHIFGAGVDRFIQQTRQTMQNNVKFTNTVEPCYRVSGGSSYRGRLNIELARLIIGSSLILQHFSTPYNAHKTAYLVRNCALALSVFSL